MKEIKRPPKDGLYRAWSESPVLRSEDDDERPILEGHFARFGEWTRIDSIFEGTFMERIERGAFKKTFKENRENIKCLFQHGRDPQVGDKPLGPFRALEEDDEGARYEVPLLDTSYNRDLEPGLREGLYGASFAFSVVREDFDREPGESEHNPDGIPERSVKEVRCYEGGPCTFPAYEGATAGIRSMSLTDQVMLSRAASGDPERLRELSGFFMRVDGEEAPNGRSQVAVNRDLSDESSPAEEISPETETNEVSDAPSEAEAGQVATSGDERRDPETPKARKWTFEKHERKGLFT
jgi:HK97 family phage prohead protease